MLVIGAVLRGAMSKIFLIFPLESMYAIERGWGVFFIQNESILSLGNKNNIAVPFGIFFLCINPVLRSRSVLASSALTCILLPSWRLRVSVCISNFFVQENNDVEKNKKAQKKNIDKRKDFGLPCERYFLGKKFFSDSFDSLDRKNF